MKYTFLLRNKESRNLLHSVEVQKEDLTFKQCRELAITKMKQANYYPDQRTTISFTKE